MRKSDRDSQISIKSFIYFSITANKFESSLKPLTVFIFHTVRSRRCPKREHTCIIYSYRNSKSGGKQIKSNMCNTWLPKSFLEFLLEVGREPQTSVFLSRTLSLSRQCVLVSAKRTSDLGGDCRKGRASSSSSILWSFFFTPPRNFTSLP